MYVRIAAIVLFVIAALAAVATDTDIENVLALMSAGLACLALSGHPKAP